MGEKNSCQWVNQNPLMKKYHDTEWGVPLHNDLKLFEFLILDTFQAGLSWEITLNKRSGFQKAFDNFDVKKISKYTKKDEQRLKEDTGIIRNSLKIKATIINAKKFLEIQKEFDSFNKYIWKFTNHETLINKFKSLSDIPSQTKESNAMSKDLKKRGFKFIGPTICYAFMQAIGMVNDHTTDCFRYNQLNY